MSMLVGKVFAIVGVVISLLAVLMQGKWKSNTTETLSNVGLKLAISGLGVTLIFAFID